MPKSSDRDALLRVVELVNNPIIAEHEFAQSLDLEFRHDPTDTGMPRDQAGPRTSSRATRNAASGLSRAMYS
jgi:hypothetical protein